MYKRQDHTAGVEKIIATITDPEIGCVKDLSEIGAVGHRMVHGGEDFATSVLVGDEVMAACQANAELAPIHNPANIAGVEACKKVMPDVPMALVFDTAFHQTMAPEAYLYAIPYEYYTDYKIKMCIRDSDTRGGCPIGSGCKLSAGADEREKLLHSSVL